MKKVKVIVNNTEEFKEVLSYLGNNTPLSSFGQISFPNFVYINANVIHNDEISFQAFKNIFTNGKS